MSEPFNKTNVAEMADRAAREIENLQAQVERLTPKAHAYDHLTAILGLLPQKSQSYGVDIAYQLRRRAEELRKSEGDPA